MKKDIIVYNKKDKEIELKLDIRKESVWVTQAQIVDLFEVDQSVVSRHIKNIFKDKEINEKSNMQKMHIPNSDKPVKFYSLDVILSVGYRTNSKIAIEFRKWATKILKSYITDGFAINKKIIKNNLDLFTKDVKFLFPNINLLQNSEALEIISSFSEVWLSLDEYDKDNFKLKKLMGKSVKFTGQELESEIINFKNTLIKKGLASELFAKYKGREDLVGIVGNVMQAFNKKDVYDSVEEKAANLLYFIVKNHIFVDGNKRSGAFAFIYFLQKNKKLDINKVSENTLTTLTLLVAESASKDKEKIIKLIMKII